MYFKKIRISSSIYPTTTCLILKEKSKEIWLESSIKIDIKVLDGYDIDNLGWFKGLSHIFLNVHIPKILLTAEK